MFISIQHKHSLTGHLLILTRSKSLLYYGWFTMLCQFLMNSIVTQSQSCTHTHTHTHTHICFLTLFSIMVYPKRLDIVPCAYSRTLLLIHSKCNRLDLPTPNSLSVLVPPPLPWQPQVYSLCLWFCFCFVDRFICVIF